MSEQAAPAEAGQEAPPAAPAVEGQATQTLITETAPAPESKNWYDGASDETIGFIENKGWKDNPLDSIAAYQNLEKFHGVPADQLIKLPKDMSEDGAMDAIYKQLGRPESADKYNIEMPEGVQADDARMQGFRDVAHKMGLNDAQVQALAKFDMDYMGQASEAFQSEHAKETEIQLNDLKREWGANFEERAELGRRFIRTNLPEGTDKNALLEGIESAIGTANTLKLFANAGDKTSREASIHDVGEDRPFGYTGEQASHDRKVLMDEITGDKTRLDNYNKGVGPDLDKMTRLNKLIVG